MEKLNKYSSIYINQYFIVINTQSGNGLLVNDYDACEFIFKPDVGDDFLGDALISSLSKSRMIDDDNFFDYKKIAIKYKDWIERLIYFSQVNSKSKIFKPLLYLSVEQCENLILIKPNKQVKLEAWDSEGILENDYIQISANSKPAEIGNAIRQALLKCQTIFEK